MPIWCTVKPQTQETRPGIYKKEFVYAKWNWIVPVCRSSICENRAPLPNRPVLYSSTSQQCSLQFISCLVCFLKIFGLAEFLEKKKNLFDFACRLQYLGWPNLNFNVQTKYFSLLGIICFCFAPLPTAYIGGWSIFQFYLWQVIWGSSRYNTGEIKFCW